RCPMALNAPIRPLTPGRWVARKLAPPPWGAGARDVEVRRVVDRNRIEPALVSWERDERRVYRLRREVGEERLRGATDEPLGGLGEDRGRVAAPVGLQLSGDVERVVVVVRLSDESLPAIP